MTNPAQQIDNEKERKENPSTEDASLGRCGNWDRNDPHQQEVSDILAGFKYDMMGILHMSEDGVMRSLTADRTVLSAQGLTPEQIHAFQMRVPESHRTVPEGVDGTKTDRIKWYEPDKGTLPPPLSTEDFEEMMKMSEDQKERLREKMRVKPNWVDVSGILSK